MGTFGKSLFRCSKDVRQVFTLQLLFGQDPLCHLAESEYLVRLVVQDETLVIDQTYLARKVYSFNIGLELHLKLNRVASACVDYVKPVGGPYYR